MGPLVIAAIRNGHLEQTISYVQKKTASVGELDNDLFRSKTQHSFDYFAG